MLSILQRCKGENEAESFKKVLGGFAGASPAVIDQLPAKWQQLMGLDIDASGQ